MALKTTDLCVIRLGKGESISAELAETLAEVDIASIGYFVVPPERPTELHYHDFDEYWLFIEGKTTVILRLPDGTKKEYEIGPCDLVATPEGVEHGHIPDETVKGFQFVSKIRPGARQGHLYRSPKAQMKRLDSSPPSSQYYLADQKKGLIEKATATR